MEMSLDPVDNAHTYAMVTHWAKAMGIEPSHVFADDSPSLLLFANNHSLRFMPEFSPAGHLLHTRELEHLREALLHECLTNLLDIGLNLDDDAEDSLSFYRRLTDVRNVDLLDRPMWLIHPTDSIILRTVSDELFRR